MKNSSFPESSDLNATKIPRSGEKESVMRNQKYYNSKFLKKNKLRYRKYQINIANACYNSNSLVVLPTALGKTIIAINMAAKHLNSFQGTKILLLAPTKPLVMQHLDTFREFFTEDIKMNMLIGNLSPLKRALCINENQILFSTPQIIKNDIIRGSIDLSDFTLVIFDEAHKARKNYAYTFVAEQLMMTRFKPFILGLTASPGKDPEIINTLIKKLFIEKVCFKQENDIDVKDYVFPIDIQIIRVNLPIPTIEIQVLLKAAIKEIVDFFIGKVLLPVKNYYSKVDFIRLNQDIQNFEIYGNNYDNYNFPGVPQVLLTNPKEKFAFISKAISGIYYLHMEEILTTQTPKMLFNYIKRLHKKEQDGLKSVKRILNGKYFKNYIENQLPELEYMDSPKISKIIEILKEQFKSKPNSKVIIFTQFREMATILLKKLHELANPNIIPKRFVGQFSKPDDKGLTQNMQRSIITTFKMHEISVLISTSIGEEGLDIPDVDAVIFYEPVPSEIRLIQRRGRTGRHSPGKCFILSASDTLDDIYLAVSFRKENRMKTTLLSEEELELLSKIERDKQIFEPSAKTDKEIFNFFQSNENKRNVSLDYQKKMIESINDSDEERKRIKLLEKYQINDLTCEIGQSALNRIEKSRLINTQ